MQDPYRLIKQIQTNFLDQIIEIWPYFFSPPQTNEDHPPQHHHYDPEKISDEGDTIDIDFFSEPVYIRNRSGTDHQKSLQKQSQKICEKEALNMNEQKPLTFDEQMPEQEKDPNRNPQSQSQASTNLQEHPKGYPTKNFLQSFKTCFLKYLEQKMGSKAFHSVQLIKKIKNKSLNLKDYEAIFKTACFKPILQQFFQNKTLDRLLLQSRIKYSLKKIYYLKLHVFQRGFIKQHFKAIN